MKILALADEECPALWDYYIPGRLKGYDLILSCGDLKPNYLSFIVTMANVPVFYVHGNHDDRYERTPPEGCDCIDDQLVVYKGLRILGLGGSARYRQGEHQYTERAMRRRIAKLRRKIKRHKGVDIVVTHAAPEGLGDAQDPAHRGFRAFLDLLDKHRPSHLIHGHVHMTYGHNTPREMEYNDTKIINAYERYIIEIPDRPYPLKQHGQVIYKTYYKPKDLDV